jgi:parvulin-like peptidyl-prolyl isomerase
MMRVLALLLAATATSVSGPSATVLARVNGEAITVADLQQQFVRRHGGHAKFLAGEVEARKFLDIVVDQRLLVQEAYRLELQDHPEVRPRTAAYSEEKQVEHLLKTEVEQKAQPTAEDVKAAWEQHTGKLYTVLQIATATRAAAEAARARVEGGEDFEKVAREVSIAPSRKVGGRLHSVGWGTFTPEWEGAVFGLAPGQVSPVLETELGFEVVRLESTKDVERPELEKARTRIESILRQRRTTERQAALSAELWTKYHAALSPVDVSLAAVQKTAVESPKTVLATWDGGQLTAGEIADDVKVLRPGEAGEREWAEQLRAMVNRPLVAKEAKARSYEKVPEVASAVRAREEDLMESVLYAEYVLRDVKVTDDEVRAWYDAHRAELTRPERRRIAQIVVADRDTAAELRQQVTDGATTFEDLARARSTDKQTARGGGDLGWIEKRAVPEDLKAVLALKSGEVSEPLASKYGVHLFKVTDIQAEQPLSFEEAQADVRKRLLEQEQRATRTTWVKQLRAAADVKVSDKGIRAFVKEAERAMSAPQMPSGHGAPGAGKPHP